jgi:site-specific DNA-methyltransferase (adenine-specific)
MSDSWITPTQLYMELDREFHFEGPDPCPIDGGHKLWLSENGLIRPWGKCTFVNPPYSNPRLWIAKALVESERGNTVVMLLKSDTSTSWFHDLIMPNAEIRFIRGRVQFSTVTGRKTRTPFPSMIAIFRGKGA